MSSTLVKGSMMAADDSDGDDSDGFEGASATQSSTFAPPSGAVARLPIDADDEEDDAVVEVFGSAVLAAKPPLPPGNAQQRPRIPPPQLPPVEQPVAEPAILLTMDADASRSEGRSFADVFDRAHKPVRVPGSTSAAQAPALEGESDLVRAARSNAAVSGAGSLAVPQGGTGAPGTADGTTPDEFDDEFGDIALGDGAGVAELGAGAAASSRVVDESAREAAAKQARAAVAAQADAVARSLAEEAAAASRGVSGALDPEGSALAATIVAEAGDLGGAYGDDGHAGSSGGSSTHTKSIAALGPGAGGSSVVSGEATAGGLIGGALVPMAKADMDDSGEGGGFASGSTGRYDPLQAARASLAGVRGELQQVKDAEAEAERAAALAEAQQAVEAATAAGKGGKRGGAIIEEDEEEEEEEEEEDAEEDASGGVPSPPVKVAVAAGTPTEPDEDEEADAEFAAATAAYSAAQEAEAAAGHGVAAAVHRASLTIGYKEAHRLLFEAVAPQEAAGAWSLPDVPVELGSAGGWFCFGGVSLSPQSQRARRGLHRIAQTAFDDESALHKRVMSAVYSKLCGGDPLSPDWTDIGFQNRSQFATDLRGGGILGPLCMLYFCDQHAALLKAVWVRDPADPSAFPFAVISLNATVLTLRAMEEKKLHSLAKSSAMLTAFMQTYVTIVSEFSARLVAMGGTDAKSSLIREAAEAVMASPGSKVAACMAASSSRSASLSAAATARGRGSTAFGMG